MIKKLKLTEYEQKLYRNYLGECAEEYEDYTGVDDYTPYEIVKSEDMTEIWLEDGFADFVTEVDHDCDPEGGCSYCGMLIDLGLKEDLIDLEYVDIP